MSYLIPEDKWRWLCHACNAHLLNNELLKARNPFENNPEETIYGCPKCKTINDFSLTCDEPDCWLASTCGINTAKGYRRTCSKHFPHDTTKKP